MDEVRVRIRPWLLLCIVFTASLLQVSVGQTPNMRVSFNDDDKNLVTLFCERPTGSTGQPATFTFTNPLDAQDTEVRSTSTTSLTFPILPENETLVSCRLNDGSVDSETVAITALPRYNGTATSIRQYVFSDSDTVELKCPLVTGRLHGLITPYEFRWRVNLEGDRRGQDEVTDVNGTVVGTFHYRDNNRLLSVNLSSLEPNVSYSFQCLGRRKRCNSNFSVNTGICEVETTEFEATNSPFFPVNIVDPVVITNPPSNINVTQGQDASFNCTVTNGEGDITIKWEINGAVYDSENCNMCRVKETDNGNSTLTVHTGTMDPVMNETTLNIVCVVNQTVPERPEGMNEMIEVRSIYRNLSSEAAQLVLSPAPPTQPPTTQPTTPTPGSISSSSAIDLSPFYVVLVILFIAIFILTSCIVCIYYYNIRKKSNQQAQMRQIFCCLSKRVELSDTGYELVDLPSPLPPPLIRGMAESNVSGSMPSAEAGQVGSHTDHNLSLTSVTCEAAVATDEGNSEQVEARAHSPLCQMIDDLPPMLDNPLSTIITVTMNSAYGTDVATAPEILTEQNEAYKRSEVITNRPRDTSNTMEITTSMSEIKHSDIMQRENQPSPHFTLTANSAYGTDVATAPEILTERNKAYERNKVTISKDTSNIIEFSTSIEDPDIVQRENQPSPHFTLTANSAYGTDVATAPEILTERNNAYEHNEVTISKDTSNIIEFSTSMTEIADPDIVQRENQPSPHFTLTANSAYGTDVATAPEILTEQNEAYERNEVTTSRDTNSTEFTTSMSEIEHSEIMRQEYQPSTYFTVKVSNLSSGLQTLV